jgi:hypothetical protein
MTDHCIIQRKIKSRRYFIQRKFFSAPKAFGLVPELRSGKAVGNFYFPLNTSYSGAGFDSICSRLQLFSFSFQDYLKGTVSPDIYILF